MERIGLDVGRVRTGVAIGAHLAREYATLSTDAQLMTKLSDIIRTESVEEVVVGMPMRADGSVGEVGELVSQIVNQIKAELPNVTVSVTNEAFSSTEAEIELKEHGVSLEDMRKRVDQYAAMLILDQYNREHPIES